MSESNNIYFEVRGHGQVSRDFNATAISTSTDGAAQILYSGGQQFFAGNEGAEVVIRNSNNTARIEDGRYILGRVGATSFDITGSGITAGGFAGAFTCDAWIDDLYKFCSGPAPAYVTGEKARARWIRCVSDISDSIGQKMQENGGVSKFDGVSVDVLKINKPELNKLFDYFTEPIDSSNTDILFCKEVVDFSDSVINFNDDPSILNIASNANFNSGSLSLNLEAIIAKSNSTSTEYNVQRGVLKTKATNHPSNSFLSDGIQTGFSRIVDLYVYNKQEKYLDEPNTNPYDNNQIIFRGLFDGYQLKNANTIASIKLSSNILTSEVKGLKNILNKDVRANVPGRTYADADFDTFRENILPNLYRNDSNTRFQLISEYSPEEAWFTNGKFAVRARKDRVIGSDGSSLNFQSVTDYIPYFQLCRTDVLDGVDPSGFFDYERYRNIVYYNKEDLDEQNKYHKRENGSRVYGIDPVSVLLDGGDSYAAEVAIQEAKNLFENHNGRIVINRATGSAEDPLEFRLGEAYLSPTIMKMYGEFGDWELCHVFESVLNSSTEWEDSRALINNTTRQAKYFLNQDFIDYDMPAGIPPWPSNKLYYYPKLTVAELLLQMLTSENGDQSNGIFDVIPHGIGLGISLDDIDLDSFYDLRRFRKSLPLLAELTCVVLTAKDVGNIKKWLSDNILKPLGLILSTDVQGKITVSSFIDNLDILTFAIDTEDLVDTPTMFDIDPRSIYSSYSIKSSNKSYPFSTGFEFIPDSGIVKGNRDYSVFSPNEFLFVNSLGETVATSNIIFNKTNSNPVNFDIKGNLSYVITNASPTSEFIPSEVDLLASDVMKYKGNCYPKIKFTIHKDAVAGGSSTLSLGKVFRLVLENSIGSVINSDGSTNVAGYNEFITYSILVTEIKTNIFEETYDIVGDLFFESSTSLVDASVRKIAPTYKINSISGGDTLNLDVDFYNISSEALSGDFNLNIDDEVYLYNNDFTQLGGPFTVVNVSGLGGSSVKVTPASLPSLPANGAFLVHGPYSDQSADTQRNYYWIYDENVPIFNLRSSLVVSNPTLVIPPGIASTEN